MYTVDDMKLVNLTPHTITVRRDDGSELTIKPSGQVARVTTRDQYAGELAHFRVPLYKREFGNVEDLPDPADLTVYIVSSLVLEAVKQTTGRSDVVAPDTGPTAIRDDAGRIVAVTRFIVAE